LKLLREDTQSLIEKACRTFERTAQSPQEGIDPEEAANEQNSVQYQLSHILSISGVPDVFPLYLFSAHYCP
jgi:hypothetical protein